MTPAIIEVSVNTETQTRVLEDIQKFPSIKFIFNNVKALLDRLVGLEVSMSDN